MSYFTENFEALTEGKNEYRATDNFYDKEMKGTLINDPMRSATDGKVKNDSRRLAAKMDYHKTKERMKKKGLAAIPYRSKSSFTKEEQNTERKKYNRLDTAMRAADAKERHERKLAKKSCKETTFLKDYDDDIFDESFEELMEAAFYTSLNVLDDTGYDIMDESVQDYAFEMAYNTLV